MHGGFQFLVAMANNRRMPVRTGDHRRDQVRKDVRDLGPGATVVGLLMKQARDLMAVDRQAEAAA